MRVRCGWPVPVLCVVVMLLAACGRQGPGNSNGTSGPVESDAEVRVGPLTPEERETFYHLAEGSEIIPYAWIRALRDPHDRTKSFLENPERFGLISDPSNPDRLPVGVTAAPTVDTRFLNIRMLGFNCSACHVNEITYGQNRLRIDGGPSRFNTEALSSDLQLAVQQTLKPAHLIRFVIDLLEHPAPPAGTKAMQLRDSRHPSARQWMREMVDEEVTAAERAFLAHLERELHADSVQNPPVNLHDLPFDSTAPGFRQLMQRYSEMRLEGARGRLHQALPQTDTAAPHAQAAAARLGSVGEILSTARMLRDRLQFLRSLAGGSGPHLPSTPDLPGRVDAFGVARNRLYPNAKVPTTAPVSFPHLWGFGQNHWLHYDANTNTVMERNLGQALGVGGVFDPVTMRSTLNPVNLHRLELLARQLPAPEWPAFFPPIDAAKSRQGEPLFGRYCAGCHQDPPADDVCYPLSAMRTDSLRAVNFALPLGNGRFTDSVAPVLRRMRLAAYQTFDVPRDQWPAMNGIPDDQVLWRTTRQYGVRTLQGVWATAPYLHNGSVPSLYELLLPAARRSTTFPLGHPEYDPVRVGYSMTAPAGTPQFDTSLPGNRNTGHEYGAELTEPERLALLEYLKTLGVYSGPVTAQPGGVACPNLNGPVRR